MQASDFIGRWQILDSELILAGDGTWKLRRGNDRLPWFSALNVDEGNWLYSLRNLGFARCEGGTGVRFKVLRISENAMLIPDCNGGAIEMKRILTNGAS